MTIGVMLGLMTRESAQLERFVSAVERIATALEQVGGGLTAEDQAVAQAAQDALKDSAAQLKKAVDQSA